MTTIHDRNDRSIPELVSEAFNQLSKLVSNEIALAKAETAEKVAQAGRSVMLIGVGVAILMPALVVLLLSAAARLSEIGFLPSVAYLMTGGGAGLIALALIGFGVSRLSGNALKPAQTIEQLQRDRIATKEMMR
ncbi:MAG: phage holin family protein [Rhodopseudomonas palustris]|nr:MAG: phage holin family protein [Rhodopseudomonas palustris]